MSAAMAVFRASRPNFLILAPLCAGLGIALAWRQGLDPSLTDAVLIILGAVLAHAAVNLLNEYQDFTSGLDLITARTPFSGGSGALPETPAAARGVFGATVLTVALVALIGLWFVWQRGWAMLLPGVAGLLLIITYTRWLTRSPVLCLLAPGLGFGPAMMLGALIALGGQPGMAEVLVALIIFALASELLLINQLPDIDADRTVGRRHLAIVGGPGLARMVIGGLLIAAFVLLAAATVAGLLPSGSALALLPLPLALWIITQLSAAAPAGTGVPLPVLGANVAVILATLALLLLALIFG